MRIKRDINNENNIVNLWIEISTNKMYIIKRLWNICSELHCENSSVESLRVVSYDILLEEVTELVNR